MSSISRGLTIALLFILAGWLLTASYNPPQQEHFTNESVTSLSLLRGDPHKLISVEKDPVDKIYARLYDTVYNVIPAFEFDIDQISVITKMNDKKSKILDAGCGVGRHTKAIRKTCPLAKFEGVDRSYQMIKRARLRNPTSEFIHSSLTGEGLYRPLALTHILALHETLHQNSATDLGKMLYNFHKWLQPNGYLVVHIMDPSMLDPAPREYSQYYKADDGSRHALTYFESFTHEAWWEKVKDKKDWYRLCEKFLLPRGRIKIKTQELWIPPAHELRKMIINHGFRLSEIVDLDNAGIQDFKLYIFKKTGK